MHYVLIVLFFIDFQVRDVSVNGATRTDDCQLVSIFDILFRINRYSVLLEGRYLLLSVGATVHDRS